MKPILLLVAAAAIFLSPPARSAELLLDKPAFQQCEAEAFIALIIARNGMHLKDTRASLLAIKSNGDFQVRTINQLFDEIEATGSKDHGGFAARKFDECAKREGLEIKADPSGAAVCLARHDIVFFATAERGKGTPQPEAQARVRRLFAASSKSVYPDALIDQLVPMTYRVKNFDDDYQLRQMVFETCLFPEDWKAWYEAAQAPRK
jgi:hypothetical protein